MKPGKLLGRWGTICGGLLAALFLAGCQTDTPAPRFAEVPGAIYPAATNLPAATSPVLI